MKRVAFIHTATTLAATFKSLMTEIAPPADIFNVVDESLLQDTIRSGELTKKTIRRLVTYLALAQETGADLIMVTCSSIGAAADLGKSMVNIPVLRVDEPMAHKAVAIGNRVGVAATLSTTLTPTASLIQRKALEAGKQTQVISEVCTGAFEALLAGDTAKHDALVREGLEKLLPKVDVVVLAQASMARIVETLPPSDERVPILSSPRLAVEHIAHLLAAA